ncbi:hypothetical protein Agabi119p4_4694 [Agaricus bisporus var. burnettii]|uniref:DNA replication checkpoint mediator MRC1 domain-containing protein n=1 Tax=Agaricus bisporus var. burnettii TaxID=192524 RepID=A0A8H7F3R7_AGABI|nr:hypothetical protein Agabi119p4_4694 [Agaricus bisporus var. burnettii]
MVRKEWLAEEAEESDEDEAVGFGFIKRKSREDDEEGENGDLDATLTELVDDEKMDEDTAGADRVMEKHQELLEQDDEAALKFHQGVVQGELRKKRKNRFGLEDSDDEEEEDDRARRIRRKMKEKVERGDIQELAANEKTAAFANIYQSGLVDDEPIEVRPLEFDFEYQKDGTPGDDVFENDENEDRDASSLTEAESDNKRQYVTYKDIQAEVQKLKEQPEPDIQNYADVSWIDERDEEMDLDPVNVHIVPSHVEKTAAITSIAKPIAEWDPFMKGGIRRKENEKDLERARAWAKNETRNMTGSTGRVVGGIAVTALGARVKDGGGSLRSKASGSSISASLGDGKKSLRAENSVLAGIAKRRGQFQ